MKKLLLGLVGLMFSTALAFAGPNGYNGFGSITRPANTTAYSANQLFAANTGGDAVATQVPVLATASGDNYIVGARIHTTGTGASGATFNVYLYSNPPTSTALHDGSTYVGPYAADLTSYLGTLTCSTMVATNDATPQYYAECKVSNAIASAIRFTGFSGSTTLYALVAVTTGYTPVSGEKLTLALATMM